MNSNSKIYRQISLFLLLFITQINVLITFSQTPVKIGKIEFKGNEHFSNKEMQNFIVSKEGAVFSEPQFDLDLKNIVKNYENAGYINCKISGYSKDYNFDSSSVSLFIEITEGSQVLIGDLVFEGNKLYKSSYLENIIDTKVGDVFDALILNRDLTDILNLYEKQGYTFVSIVVKDIEEYSQGSTDKLRVRIKIDENDQVKIDNIVVEGNTTTKKDVILREITLGENNTISRDNLLEVKRRLENLGYFESVEQPKILKYNNSTVLQIRVKEGNTNTFDGILGYVPPNQTEDNGYFTGIVNLSLRNLFGTGRRIDARFDKEIKTTQELELKYLEPWVFSYPLNINFGFLQRVEDSSFIKRLINIKSDALLSKKFSLSLIFNYERIIPTLTTNLSSIFDSRVLATGVEIRFDSRDYVYNPFSGILYRTIYTVGQKRVYNAGSFPDQNIPTDFTVQKGILDLDWYLSFFKRQSSLISVHGIEISSPKFETGDLYRFGGIKSVRGYRDGQFLASRVGWSNVELRYSLTRKSYTMAFYDFGYYLRPADDIAQTPEQEGFIYGYGLGVRVETVLGMFGVSYALGRGDSILEGKVHFGLVNDF